MSEQGSSFNDAADGIGNLIWKGFALPLAVLTLAFFFGEWYFSWIMPGWLALNVTILFTVLVLISYFLAGKDGGVQKVTQTVQAFLEYTLPFSVMPLGAIALAYVPIPGVSHLPLEQRLLFTTALSPILVAFASLLWSSFSRLQNISRDAGGYMTVLVVIYSLYSCFDHPLLIIGLTMLSSAIALMISSSVIASRDQTVLRVFRSSIFGLVTFGLLISIFGAFTIKSTLIKMSGVDQASLAHYKPSAINEKAGENAKHDAAKTYAEDKLAADKVNVFNRNGVKEADPKDTGFSLINKDAVQSATSRKAVEDVNAAIKSAQDQSASKAMSADVNSPAQIAMMSTPSGINAILNDFANSPRNQSIKKMTLDQFAGTEDVGGAALFTPPDIGGYLTSVSTIERGFVNFSHSALDTLDIPSTAWACMYSGIGAEVGRSGYTSMKNYKGCGYVRSALKASKPTDDKNLVQPLSMQKPIDATASTKGAATAWSSSTSSSTSKTGIKASTLINENDAPAAASW